MFCVSSGVIELINNRGMVCKSFCVGSFFGEKCAYYKDYLSKVTFRARGDVEVFVINRDDLVTLLNTYDEFALSFVDACKKREEHRATKADGSR